MDSRPDQACDKHLVAHKLPARTRPRMKITQATQPSQHSTRRRNATALNISTSIDSDMTRLRRPSPLDGLRAQHRLPAGFALRPVSTAAQHRRHEVPVDLLPRCRRGGREPRQVGILKEWTK